MSNQEQIDHDENHLLNHEGGRTYTRNIWVVDDVKHHEAVYETVHHDATYKTVHHDAEYRTKHHDAVYDDTYIVDGYKCSGCGATK